MDRSHDLGELKDSFYLNKISLFNVGAPTGKLCLYYTSIAITVKSTKLNTKECIHNSAGLDVK